MTAGGMEAVPIAKAATSAVSRMAGPAWRRYSRSRNLKHAAELLDRSEVPLPELTTAQAACVAGYGASYRRRLGLALQTPRSGTSSISRELRGLSKAGASPIKATDLLVARSETGAPPRVSLDAQLLPSEAGRDVP